jgi:hypothetical protein
MRAGYIFYSSVFIIAISISFFSCSGNSVKGKSESVYLEVVKNTNNIVMKENKVLILPFEYVSEDTNSRKQANAGVIRAIMFNSFYSLFSLIPSVDVPDKQELTNIILQNPEETAANYDADFIVHGNYSFSGKGSNPEAIVELIVWNKVSKNEVTNIFKVPTDMNIFEGIDEMTAYIVKSILKENNELALLKFGDFSIPPEEYELYINDRIVANPSNSDFSMNLKILSKTKYHVLMKRVSDDAEVMDLTVMLDAGETTNLSFTTNTKLITDFRERGRNIDKIYYDCDSRSTMTTNFHFFRDLETGEELAEFNVSVAVHVYGWAYAGIKLSPKQADWTGYDALSIWVAGNLTGKWFNILITDAGDERFIYVVQDSWVGWKKINIPFNKLRRRGDNQPLDAILNGVLDSPIRTLEFYSVSHRIDGRLGSYDLSFGKIELYR